MGSPNYRAIEITPQVLLKAYTCGIFPMAESARDPTLYWIEPELRGILPLSGISVPRRLARTIRQEKFEIRVDSDFQSVIGGCAASPDSALGKSRGLIHPAHLHCARLAICFQAISGADRMM